MRTELWQLKKVARRVWGVDRLRLLASVCIALALAGCVPIPPLPANGASLPAASAQNSSQINAQPTAAPEVLPSNEWQVFVDDARGLSIAYPPGWLFVDPRQKDLAKLMEEVGDKANSDEIRALLATSGPAVQEDLFVGLGFQYASPNAPNASFVNNFNAIEFETEGLPLPLLSQMIAAQLDGMEGFQLDSADLAAGLRPNGAEVVSVRYRSQGALFDQPDMEVTGWQVGVLSPDAERIVILTFSIRSQDFPESEPLLAEIVQRIQWVE